MTCVFERSAINTARVKELFSILNFKGLNKEGQLCIENICAKYSGIFHLPNDKLTVSNLYQQTINLKKNAKPVYKKPYRTPQALKKEVNRQIKDMLDNDITEQGSSQ